MYMVTKQLPEKRGEFEHRIKSVDEVHERVAPESELTKAYLLQNPKLPGEQALHAGPRSSECPAFRRDHWAVGRPSVRKFCLPLDRSGQPAGELSHSSCRP